MKIDQLLCFQAVQQHQSFSKAAEELFLSQSSVSKQIMALEDELDGALFYRKRDSVQNTEYGLQISRHVNEVLAEYAKIRQLADKHKGIDQKKLRICYTLNAGYCGITDRIIAFETSISNFHVQTMECDHLRMQGLLRSQAADLCIGYSELLSPSEQQEVITLYEEPLAAIVNRCHPLAIRKSVLLRELVNERFCFSREDKALFDYLCSACVSHQFSPVLTESEVRLSTIVHYISAGLRCTMYPLSIARQFFNTNDFGIIELEDVDKLTMSILYFKNMHSDYVMKFIDFIQGSEICNL